SCRKFEPEFYVQTYQEHAARRPALRVGRRAEEEVEAERNNKEPPQNNLDDSRLRLLVSWTDRVVPFAVKFMGLNIQRTHLIVRYFDFQRILALVELGFDLQSGLGHGRSD